MLLASFDPIPSDPDTIREVLKTTKDFSRLTKRNFCKKMWWWDDNVNISKAVGGKRHVLNAWK